jgi:uncharacterized membrane-anchored protein
MTSNSENLSVSAPKSALKIDQPKMRELLVKVPAVTAFFWIIKVLATTVGETFADFLTTFFHRNLHILSRHASLYVCAISFGVLLLILIAQFIVNRYIPLIYWTAIVVISVAGTQITDALHDIYGVELWATTVLFAVLLAVTFAIWYRSEGTLAMKSINTRKREAYYWLAILFTFALGTSAGDQLSEIMGGYLPTGLVFVVPLAIYAAAILLVVVLRQFGAIGTITAFWVAYILTRPLGANLGDLLAQQPADGGAGLGTNTVSLIFLGLILLSVGVLTITKRDKLSA